MKIQFTPSAENELKVILMNLKKESPNSLQKFVTKIKTSVGRLENFPDSGRRIPEFPAFEGREVIVGQYRFFYRVINNIVWILAIWHSAQQPTHP